MVLQSKWKMHQGLIMLPCPWGNMSQSLVYLAYFDVLLP